MFWLNVDNSTNIWKLHIDSCIYGVPRETPSKGINEMRKDGGWFEFETVHDAHVFFKNTKPDAIWQPCRVCNPSDE